MVAGSTYTVEIKGITGSVLVVGTFPPTYASGGLYFNNGNTALYNSYDLWFKTYITQESGASLNFDGNDDRVSIANQLVSNLTTFTIESWVYTTTSGAYQTIYSEGNTGSNNPMFSFTKAVNTTGFEIVLRNASSVGLVVSSTMGFVPLNTWTHVAFSRTSATTASLFINGVETDNFNFTDPGTIDVNVSDLGVRQRVAFDGYWVGNIDEFRIWNRALPVAEIMNNMNCELGTLQTGLLTYYRFNQGVDSANNSTVTTLIDASGNANTGTLNNFTLNGTTSNWIADSAVTIGNTCPIYLSNPDFQDTNFKYYPNPTNGMLTISYTSEIAEVTVINLLGQTVLSQKGNSLEMQLDLSKLAPSTYLVKVISGGKSKTIKVVKQ